ncbi:hypothetical protein GCM10027343_18840 [Noviherbaspirillum agri]
MSNVSVTEGLWFSIHIEGEEFIAFVSAEALRIHFKSPQRGERGLLRAYHQNQDAIDAVAIQKFLRGADRPIRLTASDFS